MPKEHSLVYQSEIGHDGQTARVIQQGNRLQLVVEYEHEQIKAQRFQTLPLPLYFNSFDQLTTRALQVEWQNGPTSREIYAAMLDGLNTYVSLKYPGFWVVIPVKIYEERPHGVINKSTHQLISVARLLNEIQEETLKTQYRYGQKWTGAFSNTLFIAPDEGYFYHVNTIPRFPQQDNVPTMLTVSVIDFDIEATGNPEIDLAEVAPILIKNGFSGYLIQSGDPPHGGYHFVADFIMPHSPFMWQNHGKCIHMLSPHGELARLGTDIETASTLEQAQRTAAHLLSLDAFRHRSFPHSLIDIRHAAHSIVDNNMGSLRALPAKTYRTPPRVVGTIF